MSGPRVLISGAGIAGSVLAFWLGKGGARVTVIERTPALRNAGQGIDMEGPGLEIVKRMGLEDIIRAKTTGEKGIAFVYEDNRAFATFDVGNKSTDIGFTSDIEIMRGDLCDIFFQAANAFDNVEFRFDQTIQSLQQTVESALVEFSDGSRAEYDIVVGADGLRSRMRDLAFGFTDREACIKPLDNWVAYFSIPRQEQDWPRSRGYNAPGGRVVMIRPRDQKVSSGYFVVSYDNKTLRDASRKGMQAQKAALAELFADAGWETSRAIAGMNDTEDFYLQEVALVQINRWSCGRCVLVGDAAYCSFSGTGTTLAILGGYVLAGEILRSPGHPNSAFKAYEEKLRPYVEKTQNIPLGKYLPKLVNPQTRLGIWIVRTVLWLIYWSGVLSWFGGFQMEKFNLPEY